VAVLNAHVANLVEVAFRIDDLAILNDEVQSRTSDVPDSA
jgi:hypothetical protein